jgi:ClpP class serine protease
MNDLWLMAPAMLALLEDVRRRPIDTQAAASWGEAREKAVLEARGGMPQNLVLAGTTAEIRVEGVLTKRPDFWAWLLGGGNTTYTSIRQALAMAEQDPNVKTIVLAIDSPGGSVDGLFETLDALTALRASSKKTIRVRAENAQSAAYGIAAAAGTIEATSRASTFGSIGTAVQFHVDPDVVTLTNSDSPDKRPDVTTDAGKAVVVKFLDQVNDEFAKAIAQGRDVPVRTVKDDFGRGASFTAPNALKLSMIDKISTPPRAATTSKGRAMANEDQNDAPRASAAEIDAAVQRGIQTERDRVLAHVTLGETCGDMSIALEAIRGGAGLTLELSARYQAAGMNRSDRTRRQVESNDARGVVSGEGNAPSSATTDLGDQVADILTATKGSFVRG